MKKINVMQDVLSSNEIIALKNHEYFKKNNTIVFNIMSSPGSGKTSVILETIKKLFNYKILVIEGDIAGDIDAKKIEKSGTDVYQINTFDSCHLNASMINTVIQKIKKRYDLILIENVGNLICPVEYNLGEDYKIVILSVPEGHDKPVKYPKIFEKANLLLINKIDLMDFSDFDFKKLNETLKKLNKNLQPVKISCKKSLGIEEWINWIKEKISLLPG
ncbi:MAG: hydrogenase nickel incorporation protein HypB [Spirochaetes bacterium]|nr:hydrogenase nickel incorporation protein HypB [Spirochaetota bacterium]